MGVHFLACTAPVTPGGESEGSAQQVKPHIKRMEPSSGCMTWLMQNPDMPDEGATDMVEKCI